MIRLIAAIDDKRGLAKNNRIPWHLPTDEQYFLQQTQQYGGVIIMGRKTYESIGHPLRERRNIIISHDKTPIPGAEVMDLAEALQAAPDVWVIGGAGIFEQTMDVANELYLTLIQTDAQCDRFFPEYQSGFELISESPVHHENGLNFTFCLLNKKP